MAVARTTPGYRAPYRHSVPSRAFDGVGAATWRCYVCGRAATYSEPLGLIAALDPDGPYSHVFVHRSCRP